MPHFIVKLVNKETCSESTIGYINNLSDKTLDRVRNYIKDKYKLEVSKFVDDVRAFTTKSTIDVEIEQVFDINDLVL